MSVITIEPDLAPPKERTDTGTVDPGSIFGRCPVCRKPLRPRCKLTGEPRCPPVGTGYESRAKCSGCGTILVYLGNGEWRPLQAGDMTAEDHEANRMGF